MKYISSKYWRMKLFFGLFLSLMAVSTIHIESGDEDWPIFDDSGNIVGTRQIPTTMKEAMLDLDRQFSEEQKKKFLEIYRNDPLDFHFGMGAGLRNSWGLWGDSEIARRFLWAGTIHPDTMSGVIIDEYANHLTGKGYSSLIWGRLKTIAILSAIGTILITVIVWIVKKLVQLLRGVGTQPDAGTDATR